ncbi:hypothetical protein ASPZODRAFT_129781 [Penicilliopsis zonata CBS 506.65]|uniref:Glutamyl-tRNA synthetase n=1 Tax=Penicilliopsis zonata CBS 506.65 TaxID=1073090 RepID=A0A1L9SQ08_9EURO|nr:hypothetical protein ASPZODRAFT_129781 [Penicilliopsis zonata CBS 506.65]OJJ49342.1 hypothetical protein ASPZODRAFT_129781 [Penicilliopsis zonata CBS 506.65]
MTSYLYKHTQSPSERLQLAVRAQHLRRWEVPRSTYPAGKIGYYSWRTFLAKRQAEMVVAMCREGGYTDEEAGEVGALVRKEGLKKRATTATDADQSLGDETQVLEDVACLVFLDDQFEGFEKGYEEEKVISILQKTWAKMSQRGHELALQIDMSDRAKGLVERALQG